MGRYGNLEDFLKALPKQRTAPVESWNPPDCGDIGLKILRDGTWLYGDSPIQRPELVKLFGSILRKDDDGRTYLVTPAEKIAVAVEDAPFLAVDMQVDGEGEHQKLAFRTNLDDAVVCGPRHPLRFVEEQGSGGLKPYVLVRGRLEALASRALVHDLVALVVAGPAPAGSIDAGEPNLGVWSEGMFFPLTPVDPTTGA